MNIKSLTIKNFRNFEDLHINFSDGFQTIRGENNNGKSNLYWAMRLVLYVGISRAKAALFILHGLKPSMLLTS